MEPDDNKPIVSIESDDLNDLIRRQGGDILDDKVESVVAEAEGKEPEVVVESEPTSTKEVVAGDDQLTRALNTIASLESRVMDFETRSAYREPTTVSAREPAIETVEVFQGVRLPKDQRLWPIRLNAEDIKNVGLDPDAAPGLNVLANAFVVYLSSIIDPMVRNVAAETTSSRDTHNARISAFNNAYPDLVGQEDLLDIVETRAREGERLHERFRGDEYSNELAKRARTRIAALRGQTYDQYVTQVETAMGQRRPATTSRAVTTSSRSGAGMRRPVPANAQDREMLDL